MLYTVMLASATQQRESAVRACVCAHLYIIFIILLVLFFWRMLTNTEADLFSDNGTPFVRGSEECSRCQGGLPTSLSSPQLAASPPGRS